MSLNHKEIDLVLSELDISGCQIQRILQPSFDTIVLGLYKPGNDTDLLVSIAPGGCRLHRLSRKIPKPERPLRFMECLRSRIKGGRIESVVQLGSERILRFDIRSSAEASDHSGETVAVHYKLYARLWSGAGNIILADADTGIIVDVLARRPGKGEVSGEPCVIEECLVDPTNEPPRPLKKIFSVRELPGTGSFNERVEALYDSSGTELSRDRLLAIARERYGKRKSMLEGHISGLKKRLVEFSDADRYRELGDILMGAMGSPAVHSDSHPSSMELDDFYRGGTVCISMDPDLDLAGNAREYYSKYKKAASGLSGVEHELEETKTSLTLAEEEFRAIESEPEVFRIARALSRAGTARTEVKRTYPGLSLEISGWTILIGKSAKENDELLRKHVRGSDMWLHARDWSGSYVFIKSRPGKSIPLEILLDAGCLALYYSKGRTLGQGDLYYTHAKYLRRAKDGPKGLVIPTQEKNIFVKIDETRLQELRALIGNGE
ncbi:MAG: NFACT family protein [Rectinemataceae bacterium]|nr:NFACT family protein [Rectinemataceae bacterium]